MGALKKRVLTQRGCAPLKPQIKGQSPLLHAFGAELRNENFFSHPAAKLQNKALSALYFGEFEGGYPSNERLLSEVSLTYKNVKIIMRLFEERGDLMSGVRVQPDEPFEIALKRFKREVEKEGILSELKKRQFYEKPSVRKKKKAMAARKRLLKRMKRLGIL